MKSYIDLKTLLIGLSKTLVLFVLLTASYHHHDLAHVEPDCNECYLVTTAQNLLLTPVQFDIPINLGILLEHKEIVFRLYLKQNYFFNNILNRGPPSFV